MSCMTNARGVDCESLRAGRKLWSALAEPSASSSWFWTLWSFIGLVSVLDTYLVYHFLGVMPYTEENPFCRFLINLDAETLSVFLPVKAAGTLVVLSILRLIFVCRREYSLPITGAVAAYQAGLMVYFIT
jgi:hypothetical protein